MRIHRHGKLSNYIVFRNNKAKIKYRTILRPKEQGGLDMPDFQIVNDVLKASVTNKYIRKPPIVATVLHGSNVRY